MTTLPGDHACHLENPDEFLAALERHLTVSRRRSPRGAEEPTNTTGST
ncbi:hypothetical protein ACFWP2_15740 [Kitasatospora sp. NPDC058444]